MECSDVEFEIDSKVLGVDLGVGSERTLTVGGGAAIAMEW